jgi:hypothetical protein
MKSRIMLLVVVATLSLAVNSTLFWVFEHGCNQNVGTAFDVFYWWVVTSATVGYGDIAPMTWQGRIVAMDTIVIGFFIFASFVAIFAELVHEYLERRIKGTAQVEVRNHIVICEYTAIADELIQSLPQCAGLADRDIVIVSDLVVRNPYPKHYFVCGVPISPAALKKANIEYADYVFIFANLRFGDPDVKTLHTASRVMEMNSKAKVFVEMVDPENDLLQHASRPLFAMDSRRLIKYVLQRKMIDPHELMKEIEKS